MNLPFWQNISFPKYSKQTTSHSNYSLFVCELTKANLIGFILEWKEDAEVVEKKYKRPETSNVSIHISNAINSQWHR